ncbi:MAG TPA: hypothetical protein VM657_08710 [Sphingomonas sp.]|nr:hypothetical protein [Sphingomonas sp.]
MHTGRVRDPVSGLPFRPADLILEHPRFTDARRLYAERLSALYSGKPFLSHMMGEAARAVLFTLLIGLHVDYRPDDRPSWPTLANLKRVLQTYGLSSPRRVEALVARLTQVGYLRTEAAPGDRRSRLLVPCEPMLEHDRAWLVLHYAPLALLFPDDPAYHLPLARDPDFQRAQRRAGIGTILRSARSLVSNPAIMLFGSRAAGFLILAALADSSARAADGIARVPVAELARRFAVSRAHVRRTLAAANTAGLLRFDATDDRGITFAPALWSAIDRFLAEALERHDLTGAIALRALGR